MVRSGHNRTVVTSGIPQNPKSVTEQNGQIELEGRAHFNTTDEFVPSADNPITITGTWEFVSGDDFLQILTRSDGVPNPGNCCGETLNGIEFFAFGGNEQVRISQRVAGGNAVISSTLTMPGNISAGDVFSFEITDNGEDLSFTLTRLSNPADTVTVTSTSTQTYATNLISIHNRESGRRSNLDNIIVSQGLLANDTDPDASDTLTVILFDATSVSGAAVNVDPDGQFTYDPTAVAAIQALDAGDVLTDTFTYTVTDSIGSPFTYDFGASLALGDWSVVKGVAHFRTGDGGGLTPGNSGGGFAHDGAHETLIVESPAFALDQGLASGSTALTVEFAGEATATKIARASSTTTRRKSPPPTGGIPSPPVKRVSPS